MSDPMQDALAEVGKRHGCATTDHRVCDTHYSMWLPDYGCCYFVMLPLAAIGAAVERLVGETGPRKVDSFSLNWRAPVAWWDQYEVPDDERWSVESDSVETQGYGPTLPAAIAAALGDD